MSGPNRKKDINWYPGHMAKTMRLISAEIKNVDAVVEILDARIPESSQNPNLKKLALRKPKFFVLNKADLAQDNITDSWVSYFKNRGFGAVSLNSKNNLNHKHLSNALNDFIADNVRKKTNEKPRLMFVGVPNVGKSTIINMLIGQNIAKVENRPGVTRGKQWLSAESFELLDMPGVLWEKFDNLRCAYNLAYTGAIKDDVFDVEEVAYSLINELMDIDPECIKERIDYNEDEIQNNFEIIERYSLQRGFLLKGGIPDTEKGSRAILNDLRAGRFGRISLEVPK